MINPIFDLSCRIGIDSQRLACQCQLQILEETQHAQQLRRLEPFIV